MKFRWEKKYLYGGITASCVIVFSIMFFLFLNNLTVFTGFFGRVATILTPFTIAFVIAYLLNPIMKFIETEWIDRIYFKIQENNKNFVLKKYNGIKRGLAIVISLVFGFALIISVFVMILPELYNSVTGIISNLSVYIDNLQHIIDQTIESLPWILELISDDIKVDQIGDQLLGFLSGVLPEVQNIIDNVTAGLMGAVNIVKNAFIAVVLCVYILSSKEKFGAQSKKLLFAILPVKGANSILRTLKHSDKVFGGFIVGKLIDSLIIGILCFIGLTAITFLSPVEMPFILLISTVIGITNIIPFFGPFIGGVPCGVLIFLVDPMATLVFAIFILILQQIDGNIIGPKILGDSTGLSAFWVMFAILLGGGLFGVAGMLLGVPTFSVFYSIMTGFFENILKQKGLPYNTDDYYAISELEETETSSYYMNYLEENTVDYSEQEPEQVIVIESNNEKVEAQPKNNNSNSNSNSNKNKKSKNKNSNKNKK